MKPEDVKQQAIDLVEGHNKNFGLEEWADLCDELATHFQMAADAAREDLAEEI